MQTPHILPIPHFYRDPVKKHTGGLVGEEPTRFLLPQALIPDEGDRSRSGHREKLPPLREVLRSVFGEKLPFALLPVPSVDRECTPSFEADRSRWPSDLSLTLFLKAAPSSFYGVVVDSIRWSSCSDVSLPSTLEGVLKVHAVDSSFHYHLRLKTAHPEISLFIPDLRFAKGLIFVSLTVNRQIQIQSFTGGPRQESWRKFRALFANNQFYDNAFVFLDRYPFLEEISINGANLDTKSDWLRSLKNLRSLSISGCNAILHIPSECARILFRLNITSALNLDFRGLVFDNLLNLKLSSVQTWMLTSRHQFPSIKEIVIVGRIREVEKLRIQKLYKKCLVVTRRW